MGSKSSVNKWLKLYDQEMVRVSKNPNFLTCSEGEREIMLKKAYSYLHKHIYRLNIENKRDT